MSWLLAQWRRPAVMASVSLLVFVGALQLIQRELSAYSMADLQRAFNELGWGAVSLAVGGMLASYAALALNDRHGLALIGKRLPWGRTVRASLAAGALARSLGYSWATAGAARQRLYRRWGLMPQEIGTLSFLTGTAALVAALSCAGLGLLVGGFEVARHGPFGPVTWIAVGLACLAPAAVLLVVSQRFAGRSVELGGVATRLPGARLSGRHLLILLLDRGGAAFVLFALLPDHGGWSFPAFLAVFVLAGLLGTLSGAPGGLGVFEAAILTLSPLSQDAPGAAVALVIYRLIYNVVPLVAATAILGADHASPAARPAAQAARRIGAAGFVFAPRVLAVLVFAAGLVLLASVATPSLTRRVLVLEGLDLRALSGITHALAGSAGTLLLLSAGSVWQRARSGWRWALVLLVVGALLALAKGLDWEETLALLLVAGLLAAARPAFSRTEPDSPRLTPGWLAAVAGAVIATVALASFVHKETLRDLVLLSDLSTSNDPARSLRAILVAAVTLLIAAAGVLVRAVQADGMPRLWRRALATSAPDGPDLPQEVLDILATGTGVRPEANLVLLGDKQVMLAPAGTAFAMWRPRADRWVVCGPPVGDPPAYPGLFARLHRAADQAGVAPVWYAVPEPVARQLSALGFEARPLGSSAILALDRGAEAPPAVLEETRQRLLAAGVSGRVIPAGKADPALLDRLEAVSRSWLAARGTRERTFSLGAFDRTYLARFPLAVLEDATGRALAFASVWTTPGGRDLAIDLLRHRPDAPDDASTGLVSLIASWGRAAGWHRLDLGLVPAPDRQGIGPEISTAIVARLAATLQDEGGEAHGLADAGFLSDALHVSWEPLFICAPPDVLLPTALMDVAILTADTLRELRGHQRP